MNTDDALYLYEALVRKLNKVVECFKQDPQGTDRETTYELDDFKKELLGSLGGTPSMQELRNQIIELENDFEVAIDNCNDHIMDLEREVYDLRRTVATLKGEPEDE
jgi:hypothetical protein